MTKLLLTHRIVALAVCGVIVASCAAGSTELSSPSANAVVAVIPAAVPAKIAMGFDTFEERLPPHFTGDDLVATYNALAKMFPAKGEFESSSEYNLRLDEGLGQQVIAGREIGGAFAFSFPLRDPPYDADRSQFDIGYYQKPDRMFTSLVYPQFVNKLFFGEQYWHSVDQSAEKYIIWNDTQRAGSAYIGQTRLGIKAGVAKVTTESYGLDICQQGYCPKIRGDEVGTSVPRAEAAAIKGHLRVLLVGRLRSPYQFEVYDGTSPTLDLPVDRLTRYNIVHIVLDALIVYNEVTGIIYKRQIVFL